MKIWAIVALLLAGNANADPTLWQDIQARSATTSSETSRLQHYRLLALDEDRLKEQLAQTTTLANSGAQARAALPSLSLPLPDGGFAEVTTTPTEVLAPDIAAEFPDIHTWKVSGTDGKVISGVIDITPEGFHAMLDMRNGDTLFIDPQGDEAARNYRSFRKSTNWEAFRQGNWSCSQHPHNETPSFAPALPAGTAARTLAAKTGETLPLHTYRIAIAATGEYTQYYRSPSAAHSAIVTLVNRINQVYERDIAVRLLLVNNTNIIYPNPNTDPYTNSSPGLLLAENTRNLNDTNVLGTDKYDIGHVLATDGGGLASVATTCGSFKAEGATGLGKPEGDAFVIDYVAHEIGHQLGATHTFNGTRGACAGGNREAASAYEPGSGSTIMAYTGLCSSDDLQADSDSMMHSASIDQIHAYLRNGNGASCAGQASLGNRSPSANAEANYTIPAGTPFTLTGSGSDADGDTLSYSWEQLNAGTASNVNVDLGNNALIRTHLPTALPVRTIPQMSDLIGRVQSAGEALPATSRKLDFRLLVRDGRGGTTYDDMQLNVVDTGSVFSVTAPTSTSLVAGSPLVVNWNVANTDQTPISCQTVDIALTTDSGNSFTSLLSNTPNDGSATITLPLSLGSRNHIRVKCSNNIFFALSATSPAKARTSGGSNTTSVAPLGSSGGGGTMPLEWLLAGSLYVLLRLRKRLGASS